jgi:FkbM family methyltransferase
MTVQSLVFWWRGMKTYLRDQRRELQALQEALAPDEIAVDVGANKGSYLWALSRAVPRGQVVAFEPQPGLADYLHEVCQSAGLTNVVVVNAGVSDRSGQRQLAIPGGAYSPGASFEPSIRENKRCSVVEVDAYSLDDYFAGESRRIGAIKIDVEGHELAVLRGAKKLLSEHRPLVVCECEARNMSEADVQVMLDWMADQAYGGHFVHRHKLIPVNEFRPGLHQQRRPGRYWRHPDYCNNFVLRRAA